MNSAPFSFKRKVLVWAVLGLSLATGCRSARKAQRQTAIRSDSASIDRSLEETERSLKDERIRNWEIVRTDYYPLPDSLNGSGSQPAVKSVTTIRRNEQRQRQQNRTTALATEHSTGTTISEQRTENVVPVRPTGRWEVHFLHGLAGNRRMADYPLRPPRTDETPSIAGRPRQPAHYSVTASGKRQGGRTTNRVRPPFYSSRSKRYGTKTKKSQQKEPEALVYRFSSLLT